VIFFDHWKEINNEFSIYTFPDAKNQLQFLKLGMDIQNLKVVTNNFTGSFYNLIAEGEYRNKTRDRKWDVDAAGKLFLSGFNSGNYEVNINLKRFVGKNAGYIDLGFRNVNRTPSFIFDSRSSFYLDAPKKFNNENITLLNASLFQPRLSMVLSANYYLVGNYTYFTDYYKAEQENALFNFLQISVGKVIKIGRNWVWHADLVFQQKTGNVALNLPLFYTRNRIGYEGKLGFKKLNLATGFEIKYHTRYNDDNYSPAIGQFFYQDSIKLKNRPDIAYYFHFRIRNFRAFFRAENLNAISTTPSFGFKHNNFAAQDYPYPGITFHFGTYWSFVN
jgi:hypothetical protein